MAPQGSFPLAATVLSLAVLSVFSTAQALEALDDHSMAAVTGQAQGLRITQEYENVIDALTYYDDDGLGANGSAGNISIRNLRLYSVGKEIQDIQVEDNNGRKALKITQYSPAHNQEIGSIAINGKALMSMGQDHFQTATNDVQINRIHTGGYEGNGISIDIEVPSSMRYETWREINGVRQYVTQDYSDPYNPGQGGITFKDITIDIEDDGLRIGLPTIEGGFINQYNQRIGYCDQACVASGGANLKSSSSKAFRNINFLPGGYALVKNAKGMDEKGLEVDLKMSSGSNLDYVYIFGEVGNSYPSSKIFEMSAHLSLESDLVIDGMRINVDGERGLVFDFDRSEGRKTIASANLELSRVTLQRSDRVNSDITAPSIGTLNMQLNLSNNSYIQIEGH